MYRINAAQRLRATLDKEQEVDAAIHEGKGPELRKIQAQLKKYGLIYKFVHPHLMFHKSNTVEVGKEAEETCNVLNKLAYAMRAHPGVFEKVTFAVKGNDGVCLQKVQVALRIFFSITDK